MANREIKGKNQGDQRLGRGPSESTSRPDSMQAQAGDVREGEVGEPSAYGDPLIPMVDGTLVQEQARGNPFAASADEYHPREIGDSQYNRDVEGSDPRASRQDMSDMERDYTDEERLEMFRLSMFQNQLPTLPDIPGHHVCWLTTTNPRDTIHQRMMLGYRLIGADEIPGWEHTAVSGGEWTGCIGVYEMLAAKLPMRLYHMYMMEAHHNQPLAEEGKLRSVVEAMIDQAKGRVPLIVEDGTMALGTMSPRQPWFPGMPRGN